MNKAMWSVLILGVPVVAWAAVKAADHSFYEGAAEGGLAEVEQGKLAEEKGQSQAVRDFGALMVKDHSAANEKLKAVAASKGLDLPRHPSMTQIASIGKLKLLSGEAFDKSYIKGMIKDHVDDITAFQQESRSGMDPDAKAYATATLPTLEAHLEKIRAIAAAAGVSADE